MTATLSRGLLAAAGFLLLAAVPTTAVEPAKPAAKIEYNRDIRPILAENCFACHGADSAARKADLRLDRREDAVGSGAITPGNVKKSPLLDRVCSEDPAEVMPPPKTRKTLTAAQKTLLREWVAAGAEYQAHWSFLPANRPAVPVLNDAEAKGWIRNPIDAFILAKLREAGLKPAPEADRRTLARRLSLDLTGLPPDPADVETFVADTSKDYYEKYVEKMLASPHWGEHRGRYWLDYARYGDTHGIHFDNFREVWAYRDWVIKTLNQNMPFDQFTIEQLAGDLLPKPSLDQLVATGFNRCNITTNEGGVIPEEYVVLYARDRTETLSQVYMGLTTGCAVCHDHKYDPISQKDFYSLSAFFNNTTQNVMDGNVHNTPPIVSVPKLEDRPRFDALAKEIADAKAKAAARKAAAKSDFTKWLATAKAEEIGGKAPTDGLLFHAPLGENDGGSFAFKTGDKDRTAAFKVGEGYTWGNGKPNGKGLTILQSGPAVEIADAGDFEKDKPFVVSAWVSLSKRGTNGAILSRMDSASKFRGWDLWVQADRIGTHVINQWPEDGLKVVAKTPLQPNKWYHVSVVYDGTAKAAGTKIYIDGEPQPVDVENDTLKSTIRTKVPFKLGQRSTDGRVAGVSLYDLRMYDRGLAVAEVQQVAKSQRAAELLAKPADKRTPAESDELFTWWVVTNDAAYKDATAKVSALQAEEVTIRSRGTIAHVMSEKTTEPGAFLLFRGDYDKRRDPVKADTPKSMPPLAAGLPRNRLGLAKWLLAKDHPLTTRVTVNRYWQEVFGTGLMKTSGDFGIAGELPSHPELLDWLANEFREPSWRAEGHEAPGSAWDIKQFFRLIVTSSTYRQSAVVTKEKLEKDRDNRLLSRGPRFRMEAEMIRDYALASSGLLVRKLGGPSVRPYQPEGVWEAVAMIGSNTRDYKRDAGDNLYRRSMYTFWKRSAPPASMEIFNAPSRETCTVRRDRTNTPLMALVTLNDVQFVEAARVLAEKAVKASAKDDERIDFLARRLLARQFRPEELTVVRSSLGTLVAHYKAKPEDAKKLIAFGDSKADATLNPSELAAWTMLTNQLLNLDEVLNK